MGLEAASFIEDLVVTNPLSGDFKSEGDDHLRLIKTALKATFPGLGGAAWRVQDKVGHTVVAGDNMTLIRSTGAGTIALTAAATLGNKHLFVYLNNHSAAVLIDPSGAELINGAATLSIEPNEAAFVFCTGAAFYALPISAASSIVLKSLFTTKGDLAIATGAGVVVRKGIGVNGDVMVANSNATEGGSYVSSGASIFNGTFVISDAANARTIALKTAAGADPSTSDPVLVSMPNATGGFTTYLITAAMSLVLSSGSTLGTISAQAHRIYFGLADDGGTLRLWAYNPYSFSAGPPVVHSLVGIQDGYSYSSTAEGGAGAADSAQVLYSGTAFATKLVRALGYFESTQAAAGTWATAASKVVILAQDSPRTGKLIQRVIETTGAVATGTTTVPDDDTIPQSGEGTEFQNVVITPTSAINLLVVEVSNHISVNSNIFKIVLALFQDAVANALAAVTGYNPADNVLGSFRYIKHVQVAGTVSAVTFKARAGGTGASTVTFNGAAAARKFGGALNSFMVAEEVFV